MPPRLEVEVAPREARILKAIAHMLSTTCVSGKLVEQRVRRRCLKTRELYDQYRYYRRTGAILQEIT
jgi:hypothetical protein